VVADATELDIPARATDRPLASGAPTISENLADFALQLRLGNVPVAIVAKAKAHLLDALGIALASTAFDFGRSILAAGSELGGTGRASVIGFGTKLPPANAALVNGTLIHGLDFDDTHITAIHHATAPVLAAVLGAAEASRLTGRDLLEAFIVGLEIGCRIADAAQGELHVRGFHPTGIAGTFAATYAAGRLHHADRDQLVFSASLAGSQAAGLLELGGSWLKRMHPGWAAHAGYVASVMARNGFTGARTVFEGEHGFYRAHLGKLPAEEVAPDRRLGQEWLIEGIALKPYPCCHFIHAFVDAALALRNEVDISEIVRIDCPLTDRLMPLVGEPREIRIRPRNPYDAMFSVPYVVALALVEGVVDLASFHDKGIADPAVLAVAAKVHCAPDPASDFPAHFPGEVRIMLADGREVVRREATSLGTPDRALSWEQTVAKFITNATRVTSENRAQQIVAAVHHLEEMQDVSELADLLHIVIN
jgi:2-methylcitrate dehydratase PrpD